jgi:hypothetical protein
MARRMPSVLRRVFMFNYIIGAHPAPFFQTKNRYSVGSNKAPITTVPMHSSMKADKGYAWPPKEM